MTLKSLLLAATLMVAPLCANASVMMYIERVSDSVAKISGTGTSESLKSFLRFYDATSNGNGSNELISGDLTFGGLSVTSASAESTTTNFRINFTGIPTLGSGLLGALMVTLNAETWAPVGSTGLMGNGQGSWSMVATPVSAVPLPAGLPLLVAGLGAFGLIRKRRAA